MSMWRCPHCGTPQAETARCWVCHRSSTTCSTCLHFRRSVAAQIGYCGLDRRRLPLMGTEHRGCWEASPARADESRPEAAAPLGPTPRLQADRVRDFVPVELARDRTGPPATSRPKRRAAAIDRGRGGAGIAPDSTRPEPLIQRVTLFQDLDR